MTNTALLEKAIRKSGLTKSTIAKEIGLTEKTLERRISGKSGFKASEINTLCNLLNLETPAEATEIFFAEPAKQKESDTMKKELSAERKELLELVETFSESQVIYFLTFLKKLNGFN